MNKKVYCLGVCLLLSFSALAFATKTELTFEEYETQLAAAQQQEKTFKEEIAQEQGKIEALKQQIADIDQHNASVIKEKYTVLGITDQDITAAETEIDAIRQEINLLMGLTPAELANRTGDIKKLEGRLATFKSQKVSYLFRIENKVREIESLLEQLKTRIPQNVATSNYTVRLNQEKRDCLYRIAQYDFVYNDPTQWPKLYQANRSIIDKDFDRYKKHASDPKYARPEDLIFPGQILDIPR